MRKAVWIAILFCFTQLYAGNKTPEALLNAKTAYLRNDGAEDKDFEKFCTLIQEWGHFEIVQGMAKADIGIALSTQAGYKKVQMPNTGGGFGGINTQQVIKSYILITNVKDGATLYSDEVESKNPKSLVQSLKKSLGKK
jgi:hypothetical protein